MMKWVVCSSICLAQSSADTPGEALRSAHSAATGHAETPGEGFVNYFSGFSTTAFSVHHIRGSHFANLDLC